MARSWHGRDTVMTRSRRGHDAAMARSFGGVQHMVIEWSSDGRQTVVKRPLNGHLNGASTGSQGS
eukprot:6579429-Lingulodinium_polyedra.AAC.1